MVSDVTGARLRDRGIRRPFLSYRRRKKEARAATRRRNATETAELGRLILQADRTPLTTTAAGSKHNRLHSIN